MNSVLLKWFLIGTVPAAALAGEPNRSWEVLMQSLEPGRSVVVTRMTSAHVEGKLLGITSDTITVKWHGKPEVLQREEVYRVRFANIRRTHTLSGMLLGAAIGAVFGAAVVAGYRGEGACGFALAGVGVGAGVGGAMPIGAPLYQVAGRPSRPPATGAGRK
jgi:hypothetical protein